MFGLQRDSKRHHGHHLTPQDANADRTRRKRYEVSPDGKKRIDHSSDRGYRSDDEPRRRHRHDDNKDRHRATSAYRPKDPKHRQTLSYGDTGRYKFTPTEKPESKFNQPYGEHRFDDTYATQDIYSTTIPATPALSPAHVAYQTRNQARSGHDHMEGQSRRSARPSRHAAYGDHREDYSRHVVPVSRRHQEIGPDSRDVEYGEHRFVDNEQVTGASSMKPFHQDTQPTSGWPMTARPPTNKPVSASTFRNESNPRIDDHDGNIRQDKRSPINNQIIRHVSLPSMVRDSAPTCGEHSPQDGFDSRPSTSGFSGDAILPRVSVSQYPPDIIIPTDTVSAIHDDRPSPQSVSGASTLSSRMLSPSPSLSSSGVLGPKVYMYQQLQAFEIRLVKVLPERMWKLKCEMIHVPLYTAPEYTAISVGRRHELKEPANMKLVQYAWGDGVDTRPLVLEGVTIPVAVSLHDALRAVRRKREEVLVWVDALCIDQQNKDERATQVRLMGQIYSGAISVAIWIGAEYEQSALALQLLQKVAENSVDPQYIRSIGNPDSLALLNLFKRDYWKRLWGK